MSSARPTASLASWEVTSRAALKNRKGSWTESPSRSRASRTFVHASGPIVACSKLRRLRVRAISPITGMTNSQTAREASKWLTTFSQVSPAASMSALVTVETSVSWKKARRRLRTSGASSATVPLTRYSNIALGSGQPSCEPNRFSLRLPPTIFSTSAKLGRSVPSSFSSSQGVARARAAARA